MFFEDWSFPKRKDFIHNEKQNIMQYRIGKSNQMHNLNYTIFIL